MATVASAEAVSSDAAVGSNANEGLDWIQTLMDHGSYSEALMRLEQRNLGDDVDGAIAQAVCLLHLQRPQLALQVCDRALGLQPHHPQALLFKGVALYRRGQYREAYRHYQLACQQTSQRASPSARSSRRSLSLLKSWIQSWIRAMVTPNRKQGLH